MGEDLEHCLLHGLFGIILIAKNRICLKEEAALIGANQIVKEIFLSRQDSRDQLRCGRRFISFSLLHRRYQKDHPIMTIRQIQKRYIP